jgi:hypothetical protein
LSSITALAADDIWAAGGTFPQGQTQGEQTFTIHTLIEHWNGRQWRVVPSPDAVQIAQSSTGTSPQGFNHLASITAISANNIWAVGGGQSIPSQNTRRTIPLIEHWDGKKWSAIPQPRTITGTLNGLSSIQGKIWTVGTSVAGLQGVPNTLIERSC